MTKKQIGSEPIYDARALGTPRMLVLGLQHMFAMFGATVLVPALTGLDVATTLLFAGLGTLLFHLLTKGKVPAFLGSSFAFIGGYQAIAPNKEPELLVYACVGVAAVLTPDSSRFWPLEGYEVGKSQPSYDKQFVRDWLKANPDSDYKLPQDVIDKTIAKYKEAYTLLTGKEL